MPLFTVKVEVDCKNDQSLDILKRIERKIDKLLAASGNAVNLELVQGPIVEQRSK